MSASALRTLVWHILPFAVVSLHIFIKPWTGDEPEHLHYAYLVGTGLQPYVDFFQNHMPLVWYLLSPIVLFPGFIAKIAFTKLFQVGIFALALYLLQRLLPEHRKISTAWFCASFLLIEPFNDYLDLRPEYFALPYVILVTSILFRKPSISIGMAILLGVLSGLLVFLTPRAYPVIFFAGLYMLLSPMPRLTRAMFLGSGMLTAGVLASVIHPADIFFFTFQLNTGGGSMSIKSLHYNPLIFPYIQGLVVCCVLYQLVMIRRFGWIPLALTLSLIALWQQEKAAWMTQSTLFLVVISIVYMLDLVSKLPIRKIYQGIFIGGFMALILFATVKRNVYAGANFFEKAALFSARLQQCDGMSFQSSGHGGIFRPERIGSFHPLFIPDFSYFGFYNRAYHNEATLKQILAHNEGKEIQYIGLLPPCYMDSTSQKFLQENFPEEYKRYKSVPAGQSSTTVR